MHRLITRLTPSTCGIACLAMLAGGGLLLAPATAAAAGLIAKAPELPDRVSCFNIGSGEAHTIGDLLDRLRGRARRPFETHVETALLRPSAVDIPTVACDAKKLRQTIGWRQRHTIDDMLQSLLDYWREVESASE